MAQAMILGYLDSSGNFVSLSSSAGIAISSDLTLDPTNLATSAKQDALKAVIGSANDVAWTGIGDGTVISILKTIAINTTPTP